MKMKLVKEYRLKVEGAGKGRPFDMVTLVDEETGTKMIEMKKVDYAKTEDGKAYVKAQKAQKKAEKAQNAVADQAKAPDPVAVVVAVTDTLAPNVEG